MKRVLYYKNKLIVMDELAFNLTSIKNVDTKLDPSDIIILKNFQVQGSWWKKTGVTRTGKKTYVLEVRKL